METYRQGDVLMTRVPCVPTDAKKLAATNDGRFVLALGEATGHSHSVSEAGAAVLDAPPSWRVEGYEKDGVLYLRTSGTAPAEVVHQEHSTIFLPPGSVFQVGRQREYSPEEIRNVAD